MSIEITVPRLGWSMEEGTFAGWLKNDGDFVRQGDALFELEGEKAVQEVEALDDGILRIPADGPVSGTVLKVGAVIGLLVSERESGNASAIPAVADQQANPVVGSSSEAEPGPDNSARRDRWDAIAAPSVRRLARELRISLNRVTGTGPQGRVLEDDVRAAASASGFERNRSRILATPRARRAAARTGVDLAMLKGTGRNGRIRERDVIDPTQTASASPPGAQSNRVVISKRRRVIADRLAESHRQTVPVTLTTQADATNLVSLREQFRVTGGTLIPAYHDIVAKLVAVCLSESRQIAGRWEGDSIVLPGDNEINIGLAVDTPDGLIVPVLQDVLNQPLLNLVAESSRIVAKAREGRLFGREAQNAVFTISNLGGFGVDAFTPVINLPETAILGLGTIRKQPVVVQDDRIEVRQVITLSLTFDHRCIDGAPAAKFLQSVVTAIQNPSARLISSV